MILKPPVLLDGDYGSLERNNETGKQEWTGLIGQFKENRNLFLYVAQAWFFFNYLIHGKAVTVILLKC